MYKSSEGYIWQVIKLKSDSQFWLQDIQFWWLYHLKWSQLGGLLYNGAIPLASPCSCLWLVCVIMENYFFMALLTVHKNFTTCEKCISMVLHRKVVGGAAEISQTKVYKMGSPLSCLQYLHTVHFQCFYASLFELFGLVFFTEYNWYKAKLKLQNKSRITYCKINCWRMFVVVQKFKQRCIPTLFKSHKGSSHNSNSTFRMQQESCPTDSIPTVKNRWFTLDLIEQLSYLILCVFGDI